MGSISPYYKTGRVAVNSGSRIVTGSGTNWLLADGMGFRQGDRFWLNGLSVSIDSIKEPGELELTKGWPGANASNAEYEIQRMPDTNRFLEAQSRFLTDLAANLSAFGELELEANVGFHAAGSGALAKHPLTPYARTILDDVDAAAAQVTLGISGAGRSVALRGLFVPPSPWPTEDLTPAAVFGMVGGQGYYQISRDNAGTPAQTPPGWPQTYGAIWGFISSGNGYTYSWQKVAGWSGNREWVRKAINATTWGPWSEVYHQGNVIGAVSQFGGVPGGALSTGWQSNSNGLYKRDFDGTQICIKLQEFSVGVNSAVGGEFASIEINSGSWAAAFVAKPSVSVWAEAADGVGNFGVRSGIVASATLCPRYRITSPITVASKAFSNTILAIGRWF